jgi:tetratricopeptide (TPR) repeat protein
VLLMRHSNMLLSWVAIFASAAALSAQSLRECERALYRGEYSQAVELSQRYLKQHPSSVPARVLLARGELFQGNLISAFQALHRALSIEPHNIDALYYLSFTTRALADQEYQRLFAMDPDSSRVHQLLAEAALSNQNPTQAETEFEKALRANPQSGEAATELAELKRSQSKFDEAITYYNQAAKAALTYDVAYGLGACYTYKQDYDTAIEWFRKAASLGPNSAAVHFALGNAFFQSGQFAAAIPELSAALRFEPQMKQGYFLLGRAYSKLGRNEDAAVAFKHLDELNGSSSMPGNPSVSEPENLKSTAPRP